MNQSVEYGRDAFEFIEQIDKLSQIPDVMSAAATAFEKFGFETVIMTGLPSADQKFANMVLAKKWPAEWFKIYTENNYDRVDPVVRHCKRSTQPFEWAEAPYNAEKELKAAEVMRRASEFRMARGYITPIHGFAGYEAAISLGGQDVDLNARSKPALHLMSLYAFERVRQLLLPKLESAFKLTEREREVIAWASQGKTAYEISAILNIAQRTVEEHFSTGARKLGANNRPHAVAIALRNRIIPF